MVVVVVVVVVVSGALVGEMFTSNTYEVPYHWSGFPQQTPVRKRYEPALSSNEMFESNPYQSSFAAMRLLFASYNHNIESIPYCQAYVRTVNNCGWSNVKK